MSDLSKARVLIVVFAMPGCPACEEYLPQLDRWVKAHKQVGHPFDYFTPGYDVRPDRIPIVIIDVTSQDEGIQTYADKNGINAMPTTLLFDRGRTALRHEGALEPREIDQLLVSAVIANR